MVKVMLVALVVAVALGGGFWYERLQQKEDAAVNAQAQQQAAAIMSSLYGASQTSGSNSPELSSSTAGADSAPATPARVSQPPAPITEATLHTGKGDITIALLPELAPHAVANFIKLAQSGFYDGTKFHRVIKNFMIQGGDPFSKDDTLQDTWGMGGPGYTFADEITAQSHNAAGVVAMANSGPNTNGSQFFINAVDNAYLDGKYTVFGKVIAGMDVVEAIDTLATDAHDRPLEPVVVSGITLK